MPVVDATVTLDLVGHAFPGQGYLFRGLSVALPAGRITAVVGPSGSGKTSLLSVIAGWLTPSEGRVTRPPGLSLAFVFQNPHGVPRRTALDHVTLPLVGRGRSRADADYVGNQLLRRFGLADIGAREFRSLSGGEAQRLMLARAIACDTSIILIDEPTAQLDPSSSASVVDVLGELRGEGHGVVIATHDPRVREACESVLDLVDYRP